MALIDITIGKIQSVLAQRYGIELAHAHIWGLLEDEETLARMIAWDATTPETERADLEAQLDRIEKSVNEVMNGLLQSLLYEIEKQGRR